MTNSWEHQGKVRLGLIVLVVLGLWAICPEVRAQSPESDTIHFDHTKPENVAEWRVVVPASEYVVRDVVTNPDGSMSGKFDPVRVHMVAVGHDGLVSTVSVESNRAAVGKDCSADLNQDGAVGMDDVGDCLTRMMFSQTCQ